MDRRDGGGSQAPPRPPKLLPRVHRPRAPDPIDILNDSTHYQGANWEHQQQPQQQQQEPQQPQQQQQPQQPQQPPQQQIYQQQNLPTLQSDNLGNDLPEIITNHQHSLQQPLQQHRPSCSTHNNFQQNSLQQLHPEQQQLNSITPASNLAASSSSSSSSDSSDEFMLSDQNPNRNQNRRPVRGNNGTFVINTSYDDSFLGTHPDYDNYQIHHLTYLPQRPSSLSRNSSHLSSSSSSATTAGTSFTRRRLPPTPGASVPLLTITGTNGVTSSGNFYSHFHRADTTAAPVTLAQPRPECQRHSNEYVDTPLRTTTHHLLHTTRNQHPAGQHDNGPTTTHHVLLLPQRGLRLPTIPHQSQHQAITHQTHSSRAGAGTTATGSGAHAAATVSTDRTDGFTLSSVQKTASTTSPIVNKIQIQHHQQHHQLLPQQPQQQQPQPQQQQQQQLPITIPTLSGNSTQSQLSQLSQQSSHNTPITKQPALTIGKPHGHTHGELADISQTDIVSNTNANGSPIISTGHNLPNSITCPHCGMCRCEQCQTPRLLPERWLCNKTCLCSAETVIDYASCLCCAKALFYHCARDSDMDYDDGTGTSYLENPCSCGPYKRAVRWGWLGALSLILPCLWCYWPMRGCAKLGQLCYGYVAGRGCRCTQPGSPVHMLSDMPRTVNAGHNMQNVNRTANTGTEIHNASPKSDTDFYCHLHHHHHHDSKNNRVLCPSDCTPEKRLLDATHEF